MDHHHQHHPENGQKSNARMRWVFIGFFAIAAYFLILEHQAHLSAFLNYLPYLFAAGVPVNAPVHARGPRRAWWTQHAQ